MAIACSRPARVGRYVLVHEIGAGGMGVIHAAFDPSLERRIALKMLRGQAASAEAKDRLLREARAMARLAHHNVVTVHEVGTAEGRHFVAMELIDGETLVEWLRTSKRTPAASSTRSSPPDAGWRAACTAPPQVRPAQLSCLDGVLARFDAPRKAFARVPDAEAEEIQAQLIDPEICRSRPLQMSRG